MRRFYHPVKEAFGLISVPRILGLTTSAIHTKIKELRTLESNLDAVAVTPRVHRDELMMCVNRPELIRLIYKSDKAAGYGPAVSRLCRICSSADLPSICAGTSSRPLVAGGKHERHLSWGEQLVRFRKKAQYLFEALGYWCAEFFVLQSIKVLKELSQQDHEIFYHWDHNDRYRLLKLLGQDGTLCRLEAGRDYQNFLVSTKVAVLLSFLASSDPSESKILIFVEQRVTASVLSTLLSLHPTLQGRFQCAPFVGLSNSSNRKYGMPELLDLNNQPQALADFRGDEKNMIVATNALEEGIDVQACNIVICFDLPQNVKSFIQRRGRARHAKSVYALMFEEEESQVRLREWDELERDLQAAYQEVTRQKLNTLKLQAAEGVDYILESRLTGARLTASETMAHLHHFCSCLPPQPYTDQRPIFSFLSADQEHHGIRGTVTLPSCVHPTVRRIHGKKIWKTERAAALDAAFQSYTALHDARLLNDNLLLLSRSWDLELADYEKLKATVEIPTEFNPWTIVSEGWSTNCVYETRITFLVSGPAKEQVTSMILTLPCRSSVLPSLRAYWNTETTVDMSFDNYGERHVDNLEDVQLLRQITHTINRSTHSDRSSDGRIDFLALFTQDLEASKLSAWLEDNRGRTPLAEAYAKAETLGQPSLGFLRHPRNGGQAEMLQDETSEPSTKCCLDSSVRAMPLTKRRNFALPIECHCFHEMGFVRMNGAKPAFNAALARNTLETMTARF